MGLTPTASAKPPLRAWTVALGWLLTLLAALIAALTLRMIWAGLNKGGEFGGLGFIAALFVAAAGVPAVLIAAILGVVYRRAGRAGRSRQKQDVWNVIVGLSGVFVGLTSLIVPFVSDHLLANGVAAALLALFGSHAIASLALGWSGRVASPLARLLTTMVGLGITFFATALFISKL